MSYTQLDKDTVEYKWRRDMRERFRSQQEAAATLKIPLYRLQKAYRGDLDALTGADWYKIRPILSGPVRQMMALHYFWIS